MSGVLPVFRETSFIFEVSAPDHIEQTPSTPNYIGMFSLFCVTEANKPYPLAVDIEDEETARLLAGARARQQEATIETYGYSDDIYRFPRRYKRTNLLRAEQRLDLLGADMQDRQREDTYCIVDTNYILV